MLYLGVHASISGGIIRAKEETAAIGGNCMQIFTGSPQSLELGKVYELSKLEKAKIKAALQNFPTYIHSKYLLNFGRPLIPKNKIFLKRYIQELDLAVELGMRGVVLHFGVAVGGMPKEEAYANMIQSIAHCVENADKKAVPILETNSCENNLFGNTIDNIAFIYHGLPKKIQARVMFCIDTCHIFVCGYPIHKAGGWKKYIQEFEKKVGKNKIAVVHLNDSATPFGGRIDKHADIGAGAIFKNNLGALREIVGWCCENSIPAILETHGDFKPQLALVKKMAGGGGNFRSPLTPPTLTNHKRFVTLTNRKRFVTPHDRGHTPGGNPNQGIIALFAEFRDYHKAKGNIYQYRAYENIIEAIAGIPKIKSADDVKGKPGIGEGALMKIAEYLKTGRMHELDEIRANKNVGALLALEQIYGVGPKIAADWAAKGYSTVAQIKKAHDNGSLQLTKQQAIGIKYFRDLAHPIPRKDAIKIFAQFKRKLPGLEVELMGSFGMKDPAKQEGKDLDILVVDAKMGGIVQSLGDWIVCEAELGEKMGVFLMKFPGYPRVVHVDLKIATKEQKPFYTLYFRSGEKFSRKIRKIAKDLGYKLNQYGLFKNGRQISRKFKNEAEIVEFLAADHSRLRPTKI
jgi:deoxyribonuclease-4